MLIDDEIGFIQEECEPKLTERQIEVIRQHMARYAIAAIMDSEVQRESMVVAWSANKTVLG